MRHHGRYNVIIIDYYLYISDKMRHLYTHGVIIIDDSVTNSNEMCHYWTFELLFSPLRAHARSLMCLINNQMYKHVRNNGTFVRNNAPVLHV